MRIFSFLLCALLLTFSTQSHAQVFPDFDMDGVPDYLDLDDDNDGVPDAEECQMYTAKNTTTALDSMLLIWPISSSLVPLAIEFSSAQGIFSTDDLINSSRANQTISLTFINPIPANKIALFVGHLEANRDWMGQLGVVSPLGQSDITDFASIPVSGLVPVGLENNVAYDSSNFGNIDLSASVPNKQIMLIGKSSKTLTELSLSLSTSFGGDAIYYAVFLDTSCDTDGDGSPDHLDLDSDDDGILDILEVGGVDTDGDGQVDNMTDIDNDGLEDTLDNIDSGQSEQEVTTGTPLILVDSDGNEIPDIRDPDFLPLELVAFAGTSKACSSSLHWKTASETGISHFSIEKSLDGIRYEEIGTKKALNQFSGTNYQYEFPSQETTSYYRLKIVELDGYEWHSQTINIRSTCQRAAFSILPNPVGENDIAVLQIENSSEELPLQLMVRDVQGKLVMESAVVLKAGYNEIPIDMQHLDQGLYFISLSGEHMRTETLKIIR